MFIDATRRRNPGLLEAAVELHRSGRIPANTYLIDVDTVRDNARLVSAAGAEHGLELLQMTKQFGRNPVVAQAVADGGIEDVVAVDFDEARVLHRHGLSIGHLGHLVQVPSYDRRFAVEMAPKQITVFDVQQAAALAETASAEGYTLRALIRVVAEGDRFYPAQEGGIDEADVVSAAKQIDAMTGIEIVGVTSFPCLLWDEEAAQVRPTPNLATIGRAAAALRAAGFEAPVVNAPSVSCIATFELLRANGATQAEPGSCFTGHTPLHAISDQPERPAMIYVTEITHRTADAAYALGGGLYPRSRATTALVHGRNGEVTEAGVELDPADAIDYYGKLRVDPARVDVGDTVVYAFRSQVFVAHSFVAPVTGVATGEPEVLGLFSELGWPLDERLEPAGYAR